MLQQNKFHQNNIIYKISIIIPPNPTKHQSHVIALEITKQISLDPRKHQSLTEQSTTLSTQYLE
jgi:hypothetical protein